VVTALAASHSRCVNTKSLASEKRPPPPKIPLYPPALIYLQGQLLYQGSRTRRLPSLSDLNVSLARTSRGRAILSWKSLSYHHGQGITAARWLIGPEST